MRKTVSGLTGTFSKFTGSLGKGLAAATMDTSFQRARRTTQARNRPLNAAEGVTTGAKSFYQGFASGLQGIVEKPLEGARQAGVGGFFRGVGVGLLGAVTKPIVGVVDLTTSITEGVKGSADGEEDEISQIRWPRVIPHDSIIQVLAGVCARGLFFLTACLFVCMHCC
jgi:vacuolar protein sorting-associated protein 13A/C